ncbi:6,7-dimethyl-8-ribityllumazine synthase [Leucobacter sp. cx-328]|uniref:6,7-dimethyl-8-ribityllumazine synthase n=1 Tax=unclassified Leucobacter TaxID=2621730 RepID=UPI00165D3035|nr:MULTISPECIES: 6,7-dimethyl-8-ribityllumazine synthase [unclassified Leucobacter]MBC9943719.1 6,7-dimethyl-8-ribityllumazine synthase [Leucobacter sp. cx-328]
MSGAGAPDLRVDATGLRVAVIAGSWHQEIMNDLIKGAHETIMGMGADHTLFRVGGAFELPLAAQAALTPAEQGGGGFDAVVCLGIIIRGGTPHFDFVANAVTDGLTRVQLDTGRPVGFGILTTDNEQQAIDRSGAPGAPESKGKEAAEAALHLAVTARRIRTEGPTMRLVPGTPQG